MIAAWLIAKALAPRYAIVVTLLVGGIVAWAGGDVVTDKLTFLL
jgi:benzoate membrane transport protein